MLLTATNPHGPTADVYTGQIVEDAALVSRGYAVVEKPNRENTETDRPPASQAELSKAISAIVAENGIRCILDIQGKAELGIEIWTGSGLTASEQLSQLVRDHFSSRMNTTVSSEDNRPRPGSIIAANSAKGKDGTFAVEGLEIRIGQAELAQREKLVSVLAELISLINGTLKPSSPATELAERS